MMEGVKILSFLPVFCVLSAALWLLMSGCAPKTTDPEQLRAIHEQNAELRSEIAQMEGLIKEAGEDVPNLNEQIADKEAEIAAAIRELDELDRKETDMRLRVIELQDRLDAFRAAFRMMQNEIANRQH